MSQEFTAYCLDFYGPKGIYKYGFTEAEIIVATEKYQSILKAQNKKFYGDTVDRENVRDIVLEAKGLI